MATNENLLRLAQEVDENPADQSKAQQLARQILQLDEYGDGVGGDSAAKGDDGDEKDAQQKSSKGSSRASGKSS